MSASGRGWAATASKLVNRIGVCRDMEHGITDLTYVRIGGGCNSSVGNGRVATRGGCGVSWLEERPDWLVPIVGSEEGAVLRWD